MKKHLQSISENHPYFLGSLICLLYSIILLLSEFHLSQGLLNNDSAFYIDSAIDASNDGIVLTYNALEPDKQYPPLLFVFMTILTKYTHISPESAGRVLNIIPCMLAAIGVYFCSASLYSSKYSALFTSLTVLSLPIWYNHGSGITRDPLYWMFSIWLFFCILYPLNHVCSNKKMIILSSVIGVLSGLLMITRKEATSVILPSMILFLGFTYKNNPKAIKTVFFHLGVILSLLFIISFIPKMFMIEYNPYTTLFRLLYENI